MAPDWLKLAIAFRARTPRKADRDESSDRGSEKYDKDAALARIDYRMDPMLLRGRYLALILTFLVSTHQRSLGFGASARGDPMFKKGWTNCDLHPSEGL